MKGELNPRYGAILNDSTKLKIGDANRGRVRTDEHKKNIKAGMNNPDIIKKISDAAKNRDNSKSKETQKLKYEKFLSEHYILEIKMRNKKYFNDFKEDILKFLNNINYINKNKQIIIKKVDISKKLYNEILLKINNLYKDYKTQIMKNAAIERSKNPEYIKKLSDKKIEFWNDSDKRKNTINKMREYYENK